MLCVIIFAAKIDLNYKYFSCPVALKVSRSEQKNARPRANFAPTLFDIYLIL
jgi:hypothetical protein